MATRDDVQLLVERWNPERVDHIRRGEVELNQLADREVEIGSLVDRARLPDVLADGWIVGCLVVERPGPFLADDIDRDLRVRLTFAWTAFWARTV